MTSLLTIAYSRHICVSVHHRIDRILRRYETLDPPLAEQLRRVLGARYHVYEGDNHISLLTVLPSHLSRPGRRYGESFALIRDGITI